MGQTAMILSYFVESLLGRLKALTFELFGPFHLKTVLSVYRMMSFPVEPPVNPLKNRLVLLVRRFHLTFHTEVSNFFFFFPLIITCSLPSRKKAQQCSYRLP